MLVGGPVERRSNNFALDGSPHIGDFFGALGDQQHDEVHIGIVDLNRAGNLLENHRLSRLRWRDDHPRWPRPIGETRSMMRAATFAGSPSSSRRN